MKRFFLALGAVACALSFSGCTKKSGVKIGIAKIVQHVALDDVERGVMDAVKAAGIDATFDLQNANGDVNTANQIASQFKDENVAVAVGIAYLLKNKSEINLRLQ